MVKMTNTTGMVQLITNQPHHLIDDPKPPQPTGWDTTRLEKATQRENQHPIETINQPPAGQPKVMHI
jgi:hypothetical protein